MSNKKVSKLKTSNDINIEQEIGNLRKNLKTPISGDIIDDLDFQIDKLNETTNLGEKIALHSKITEQTTRLENEVDRMIDILDSVNFDTVSEIIKNDKNKNDNTDVSDDIVNIEKLLENMKDEDVMQIKLLYMQKITDQIQKCRVKCDKTNFTINKCN